MYMQTPLLASCTVTINSKLIKSSQITSMQHFINEVNSCGVRLQLGRAQYVSDTQQSVTSKGGLALVTEQSLVKERDC